MMELEVESSAGRFEFFRVIHKESKEPFVQGMKFISCREGTLVLMKTQMEGNIVLEIKQMLQERFPEAQWSFVKQN